MFWNTFLSILGVIGIIAVSAFVIVFLSDLFISIVDGSNGIFFKRNKNKIVTDDEEKISARPKMLDKPVEQIEDKKEDRQEEIEEKEEVAQEQEQEIDMAKAEEEEALAKQSMGIEEAKSEVVEAPQVESEEEKMDDFILQINEETRKVLANEPVVEPVQEQVEQPQEDVNQEIVAENESLKREIEELRKKIESDEESIKELEELKRQVEDDQATIKELEEKQNDVQTVRMPSESKEELEARLEVLKQRLKENEKELSANRKEFVPLRRVNMTLDSDKKKLRRKEAIVAKQKVVLYGVNNYVDIDEEKAKKLSEELDLLEGLRLSVQHCEEVMQKNKDRYPILESANKFLVRSQSQLKEDIAEIENKLALLESNDNDNNENE